MTTPSKEPKKSSGLLITLIVIFIAIEAFARVGQTIYQDIKDFKNRSVEVFCRTSPIWYTHSPEIGWEKKPGFKGKVYGFIKEFDSEGFFTIDSMQILDTGKPKVVFIGSSDTFGHGVPTGSTYTEQLEEMLPHIDAINLGVNGYSSYQGYKVLQKYAQRLKPEIAVISFGFNDRRSVLDESDTDNELKFRKAYEEQSKAGLKDFVDRIALYRSIKFLISKLDIVSDKRMAEKISINSLHPRVNKEEFRKNLVDIIKLARENKIKPVFLLTIDNPEYTRYLRMGVNSLAQSRIDEAIENLKLSSTHRVLSRKYLAKAYREKGMDEEADRTLMLNKFKLSFMGGPPVHMDTEYNQIVREVAEELNVVTVDATKMLLENPSFFIDSGHFGTNGHHMIARLLSERISELLSNK